MSGTRTQRLEHLLQKVVRDESDVDASVANIEKAMEVHCSVVARPIPPLLYECMFRMYARNCHSCTHFVRAYTSFKDRLQAHSIVHFYHFNKPLHA